MLQIKYVRLVTCKPWCNNNQSTVCTTYIKLATAIITLCILVFVNAVWIAGVIYDMICSLDTNYLNYNVCFWTSKCYLFYCDCQFRSWVYITVFLKCIISSDFGAHCTLLRQMTVNTKVLRVPKEYFRKWKVMQRFHAVVYYAV